jgi:hypothetical protein
MAFIKLHHTRPLLECLPAYSRIIVSRLILALFPQMFKTITLPQQHNCHTEDTESSRQAARKLPTKNNNNNNPMHSQTYNKNKKSKERQTKTSLIHNVSYYSLVSSAVSLIAILLRSVDFTYATTTMRRRRRRGALGHTRWDSSNDAVHQPFPSIFTDQH